MGLAVYNQNFNVPLVTMYIAAPMAAVCNTALSIVHYIADSIVSIGTAFHNANKVHVDEKYGDVAEHFGSSVARFINRDQGPEVSK